MKLKTGQPVLLAYRTGRGFICERAICIRYESISGYKIPVFQSHTEEVSGLDCFWILPKYRDRLEELQYELIRVGVLANQMIRKNKLTIPNKLEFQEIRAMAENEEKRQDHFKKRFGFELQDELWVEQLASTIREKNWFRFEAGSDVVCGEEFKQRVDTFNRQFNDRITPNEAKVLSKKRMRFVLGAYPDRVRGEADPAVWKKKAKAFEERHRSAEERMKAWSEKHAKKFPTVRTKTEVEIFCGPYLSRFLENVPEWFVDDKHDRIRSGITLRVIAWDAKERFIRLDVPEDIREKIKGKTSESDKIWIKDDADYDFIVLPDKIEESLDFLEAL